MQSLQSLCMETQLMHRAAFACWNSSERDRRSCLLPGVCGCETAILDAGCYVLSMASLMDDNTCGGLCEDLHLPSLSKGLRREGIALC